MNNDFADISKYCITSAKLYDVNAAVHPEDMIFRFVIDNPVFPNKAAAVNYYFQTGKDSVNNFLSIMKELDVTVRPMSVLEFASGYGCVSRHFIKIADQIDLTSCDIHLEAINYLKQQLGIQQTILSAHTPEAFSCDRKYDVVFALSFFSHMPRRTWGKWLEVLYDKVKPGGYMIFTTQGLESAKYFGNPIIPDDGFWFKATSEQKDIELSEYGQTLCTYEFVSKEINLRLKTSLAMYKSGYWWGHQDAYMIAKSLS